MSSQNVEFTENVEATQIRLGTSASTRFNIPVNSIPEYPSQEAARAALEVGDLYRLAGEASVLRIVLA